MPTKRLTKKRKAEIMAMAEGVKAVFKMRDADITFMFEPCDGEFTRATTGYIADGTMPHKFEMNFDPDSFAADKTDKDTLETILHEFVHAASYPLNCEIDGLLNNLAPDHHKRVSGALEAQTIRLANILVDMIVAEES